MLLNVLKGKIHRATVTQAELDYVGSSPSTPISWKPQASWNTSSLPSPIAITAIALETYVIAGEPGSGVICLNGAAAHLVNVGDKVIIMNYCQMTPEEFKDPANAPHVVFVDDDNKISRLTAMRSTASSRI